MDEDFADGRVVQFGHDATTLGQGAQVGSGVQCPFEYLAPLPDASPAQCTRRLRPARRTLIVPRLLDEPELPFAPQLESYLFMGEGSACLGVGHASGDGLDDVEVVQHVVETAVVWEPIEKCPNGLFRSHRNLHLPKW